MVRILWSMMFETVVAWLVLLFGSINWIDFNNLYTSITEEIIDLAHGQVF